MGKGLRKAAEAARRTRIDDTDRAILSLLRRMNDGGIFWPAQVAPINAGRALGSESVKRRLKSLGYAEACPTRDGYWRLTDAGRVALTEQS